MVKEDIAKLTDEELVHRYRNSHETSYIGELYQRYTHLVFGVCVKYLKQQTAAEDATMQIFEKLISDLKKHHIVSFKPWLHTVVKNHCMMEFRKNSTELKNSSQFKNDLKSVVETAETDHLKEAEEKEFILEHLKEGIDELKSEQRECIELFYLKDCSYNEISKITGYNTNEVKSYIQNGKRNLKNYITAQNDKAKQGNGENR
ncbi:MAG: sigma-70 family RNA polymerase sigma factor [Chitinophagales bacterium]